LAKFIAGIVVTVLVGAAAIYIYFSFGMAPVATAAQAMPFEKALARMGLHARVEKEMPKNPPPVAADESTYTAGAQIYIAHCAVCHGLPGHQKTSIAKGEFPIPPQLFEGHGVTDDEAGETYWKVENGIRLSGMPSYKQSLSTTQMWQVSLLLKNADKLPNSVTQTLTATTAMPLQ
jgi:mono/diheme cytochrome c family protein